VYKGLKVFFFAFIILIADERPSRLHHRFLPCQVPALLHRLRRPTLQNKKQSATKGIRSCRAVVEKAFVQTAGGQVVVYSGTKGSKR
jgi:hypothetical protein